MEITGRLTGNAIVKQVDGSDRPVTNFTVALNRTVRTKGYAMMADSQQMETTKGTLFGAYNAITGYFQNVRTYKDSDDKINSLLCGGTAQKKAQLAFNLCSEFAKHGADALALN